MSVALERLAREVGSSERTLRRAIAQGTLRAERPTPHTLRMDAAERRYVRSHWPLLRLLRDALRTEPNVETALLFGSVARGEDTTESDLDLVVWMRAPSVRARRGLRERLETLVNRPVEILDGDRAEREPGVLAAALDDGRVLVDRAGRRQALRAGAPSLRRRAARQSRRTHERARAAAGRLRERAGRDL